MAAIVHRPSLLPPAVPIVGSATDPDVDILEITTGGDISAAQLANISGMDELFLPAGVNSVTLTNALVAGASSRFRPNTFAVIAQGAASIDASAVANAQALYMETGDGANTLRGGNGNDVFFAGNGSDILFGGDGNDVLIAHTLDNVLAYERDELHGGSGDDTLYASGDDLIDGGAGFDVLQVINDKPVILDLAAAGIEYVVSGSGNDVFIGIAGSNGFEVYASGGDDIVIGGNGPDRLWGEGGNDVLMGGGGDDLLAGGFGIDILLAGDGNDTLLFDRDDLIVDGGTGWDVAYIVADQNDNDAIGITLNMALSHIEWLKDLVGDNDTIDASGTTGGVEVYAGGGNDTVTGGSGNDIIWAGPGNDIVIGGSGNDTLLGEDGDDSITGGIGADRLFGGNGDDQLYVDSSDTVIDGGGGTDTAFIVGGTGVTLNMTSSSLEIIQDNVGGNDTINGVGFGMQVRAGGGDDTIGIVNSGFTDIAGGAGLDRLVLTTAGQSLDLTAAATRLHDLEIVSLNASFGATLTLDSAAILQMNSQTRSLYVLGGSDDQLNSSDIWDVVTTTHVNPAVSNDVFIQFHNEDHDVNLFLANTFLLV